MTNTDLTVLEKEILEAYFKMKPRFEEYEIQRRKEEAEFWHREAMKHFLEEREKMEHKPRIQINIY
jgi:hypothetical protein